MVFIIGAHASGQEQYAKENYGNERVFENLHEHIAKCFDDGLDVQKELDRVMRENDVITADEVGCGIIPMDAHEREKREVIGRACCIAAKRADRVIRMVCGIAQVLV